MLGLLLWLIPMSRALAQRPALEAFTVEHGLPSSHIFDLAQDPSGRLWILSRNGITIYDGHAFKRLDGISEMPMAELAALEMDDRGRAWAVNRLFGPVVYKIEDGRWQRLPSPEVPVKSLGEMTSLAVLPSTNGERIAVGSTNDGLWLWDGAWVHWSGASLPSSTVGALAAWGDQLAVGTAGGLCFLKDRDLDCQTALDEPKLGQPILALHAVSRQGVSKQLWVLGVDWLGTWQDGRFNPVVDTLAFAKLAPTRGSLAVDTVGGVYFGSQKQIFFLDAGGKAPRLLGEAEGLASEGVTTLLLDRERNMWVGGSRGLSKIEGWRFQSFDQRQGLLEDEVSAIVEPSPGQLVLGHDKGLSFVDDENVSHLRFERPASSSISSHRILDMALDTDGSVWLAAHQMGLWRLDPERQLHEHALTPDHQVTQGTYSVEFDAQGRLWVAGFNGLYVRDGSAFSRVEHGQGSTGFLRWLTALPDGRLFVSTRGGLLWQDRGTWHRARGPTSGASNVYGVHAEPNGPVWVGTSSGLYELIESKLVRVEREGLRIDRPIYFILEDGRGHYWFGSDDGVRVWNGSGLRHLTVEHGLAGRETNRGAALVDHSGHVWIGTNQGVSIYQRPYDAPRTVAPGIELTSFEVNGVEWPWDGGVRLSHLQRSLSFRFDTIAFSGREELRVRYQLEDFDQSWQSFQLASRRESGGPVSVHSTGIRYTNVPPGEYRFRIAASWNDGPWSDEVRSPAIVITTPVWRQSWFYGLVVVSLALAALAVHGLKTRVIRARNVELEKINVKLSDSVAERQSLIAELEARNAELERFTYTVSHDLKSPLFTAQGFLGFLEKDALANDTDGIRRDVETIRKALRQMAQLLDELLELSRIGRVANPPESVSLAELVDEAITLQASKIEERGVSVEIAADLPVVSGDRIRLLEVLQNLVENAVKYMGDQPSPRIEIGVRREQEPAVIYVRDNGMGIKPRYHKKIFGLFERLDQRQEGTGIGLALVKRIVEFHGGRIWVESQVEGRGSTFCFTLPPA